MNVELCLLAVNPLAQCATQTSGWIWTTWRWPKPLSPAQLTSPPCCTPRSTWTRSKLTWKKVASMQRLHLNSNRKNNFIQLFIFDPFISCNCRTNSRATRKINFEENSQTFTISSLTEKSIEDTNISLQVGSSCCTHSYTGCFVF